MDVWLLCILMLYYLFIYLFFTSGVIKKKFLWYLLWYCKTERTFSACNISLQILQTHVGRFRKAESTSPAHSQVGTRDVIRARLLRPTLTLLRNTLGSPALVLILIGWVLCCSSLLLAEWSVRPVIDPRAWTRQVKKNPRMLRKALSDQRTCAPWKLSSVCIWLNFYL